MAPPVSQANRTRRLGPPASGRNTALASCIVLENSRSRTRSASTTTASTSSLKRPRPPVSVVTAAVIVGEALATMIVINATVTARAAPVLSGETGSQGQASQTNAATPAITIVSVAPVKRAIEASVVRRRSRLIVNPAISAISVVAIPVTACSCDVIGAVITLPTYGPTSTPKIK